MGTFEAAEKAAKSKKDKQAVSKPTITTKAFIVTATKRQRRLKAQKHSEKNKWLIQHPKIQSMERREQIYVKDAGLNETKAEKRQTPIDPKLDLMSPEVKFGRMLAGTDQRKRHAAVKKLKAYLKARCDIGEVGSSRNINESGISELDLLKLWKALWYTLYMADKKPVQDELSKHVCKLLWCVVGTEEEDECAGRAYLEMVEAETEDDGEEDGEDDDGVTLEEIENTLEEVKVSESDDDDDGDGDDNVEDSEGSDNEMVDNDDKEEEREMNDTEIPHCRGAHLVSLFARTFFRTIRREWHMMDKYRVNKFYTLIRTMMHEIYEYLALRGWNYGIVLLLNDAIFDEILKQPPNGLRYHLIDLCLEELAKVNAKAKIPLTEATFLDVLEPFFGLCQTGSSSHDDTVQTRVMDRIFDNFLENYCVVSDRALQDKDTDENGENEDESCGIIFDQVHVKTVAEFSFTLGSDPETSDKYRKSLYDMHKKYMRRLKQIGKDVELESDDDNDMSQFLTEENNEEIRDDSAEKLGRDDDNNYDCGDDVEEKQPLKATEVKKESKKKKKKRKSDVMETTNDVVTPEDKTTQVDKKSKKKKHKVVFASSSTNESQEKQKLSNEDKKDVEEVVITLREQKEAKKKEKKAKKDKLHLEQQEKDKKQNANDELNTDNEHGPRRVSFGKKNRAKSHKASMKALRTTEPPSTKETTPVKGILPKNYKYSGKIKTTKGGRKKASSYF
mmetsp:Transcript_2704/g.2956  ORF Transcript_2704/g.2956 Transcript_2704/m.2956 type:complete len:730 (-) Transcript_2704:817-3006(-)